MEFLSNSKVIADIAERLTRSRKVNYSEWPLQKVMLEKKINQCQLTIVNKRNEQLRASLHYREDQIHCLKQYSCILTLHGYGSNRLQTAAILAQLPPQYVVCSIDFSGSGKSQGNRVSFGLKQQHDIHYTLNYLREIGCVNFILWGRSMGATSALLYCNKYQPKDVCLQILDSPFYSFENVAIEIACKQVAIPSFFVKLLVSGLKDHCKSLTFNPFQVQLNDIANCKVPALFVYSRTDEVVQYGNSEQIIAQFKAIFERLVIKQGHNTARQSKTLNQIFSFISKYQCQQKRISRAISYFSNNNQKNKSENKEQNKNKFIQTTLKRDQQPFRDIYTQKNIKLSSNRRGLTLTKIQSSNKLQAAKTNFISKSQKIVESGSAMTLNYKRSNDEKQYQTPKPKKGMTKLSLAKSTVGILKNKMLRLNGFSSSTPNPLDPVYCVREGAMSIAEKCIADSNNQ